MDGHRPRKHRSVPQNRQKIKIADSRRVIDTGIDVFDFKSRFLKRKLECTEIFKMDAPEGQDFIMSN
jgi:hypothetical protein